MADLDRALVELAEAYSIATEYWDWRRRHVAVSAQTIVDVLAGFGVDAATPDAVVEFRAAASAEFAEQSWEHLWRSQYVSIDKTRSLLGYAPILLSASAGTDSSAVADAANVDARSVDLQQLGGADVDAEA